MLSQWAEPETEGAQSLFRRTGDRDIGGTGERGGAGIGDLGVEDTSDKRRGAKTATVVPNILTVP